MFSSALLVKSLSSLAVIEILITIFHCWYNYYRSWNIDKDCCEYLLFLLIFISSFEIAITFYHPYDFS